MADTKRAIEEIDADRVDSDLLETLLTSRSEGEAAIAYSMLREVLPSRALVMLANLREIIAELPDPPFSAGTGLDMLVSAGGYAATGYSYRRIFEDEAGVFGVEFFGSGTLCEGVVVHSRGARFVLHGCDRTVIGHAMMGAFLDHDTLLDSLLEGLQILGYALNPKIYVAPDDFLVEHGGAAARSVFEDLF